MLKTNRRSGVNPTTEQASRTVFRDIVKVNEGVWYQMGLEFGVAIVSGELDKTTATHLRRAVREIALATDIYLKYANHEQLLMTPVPMTVTVEKDLPLESGQSSLSPPQTEQ